MGFFVFNKILHSVDNWFIVYSIYFLVRLLLFVPYNIYILLQLLYFIAIIILFYILSQIVHNYSLYDICTGRSF